MQRPSPNKINELFALIYHRIYMTEKYREMEESDRNFCMKILGLFDKTNAIAYKTDDVIDTYIYDLTIIISKYDKCGK